LNKIKIKMNGYNTESDGRDTKRVKSLVSGLYGDCTSGQPDIGIERGLFEGSYTEQDFIDAGIGLEDIARKLPNRMVN